MSGKSIEPARVGVTVNARIVRHDSSQLRETSDVLVSEEPLEIRLRAGGTTATVAITMRTPGNDFELAAGFLFAEGIIGGLMDIRAISYCVEAKAEQRYNIVNVDLESQYLPALDALERHFTTSSACGVCGKAHLDQLHARGISAITSDLRVSANTIIGLPDQLRTSQQVFSQTGGLHAAAGFDHTGKLLAVREDVGRHNALDKLIGYSLLERRFSPQDSIVLVSGRSSFELVQKAAAAGVPILCAVSAPSSLAVQLAKSFGVTLVGFLRGSTFNVYAGAERIIASEGVLA